MSLSSANSKMILTPSCYRICGMPTSTGWTAQELQANVQYNIL